MLRVLNALLLCVVLVTSVGAHGPPCKESDDRFVRMKNDYLQCLEGGGVIPSVHAGTAWLERLLTENEMQQMCANEVDCQGILRYWYASDHPPYAQECVIPTTNLTLSYDLLMATQFYCTFGYRPQSPEEVLNPPKQPKPLAPVDCDKRLMNVVFDQTAIGAFFSCQRDAQVNLRSPLTLFQLNRMKSVSNCQQFANEGLKLTRGTSCHIPQTSLWADEYFEQLSSQMTSSPVPVNGKVCTEADPRLHGLDRELQRCRSRLRGLSLPDQTQVLSVDRMDTMCMDHSCQLLLRKFVLTPHKYAEECFLPGTSLTFGYDIMLATHFYCVFSRFANSIEEIDTPPRRVPGPNGPPFPFAPFPDPMPAIDEPPAPVEAPEGPPECNWYVMDMVFGEMSPVVACEAASGVKLRQPDHVPTDEDLQAMQVVPACHSFAQEVRAIAKGETCLIMDTKISIEELLATLLNLENASPTNSSASPSMYRTCTRRDVRFNDVMLEQCAHESGIHMADLRKIPDDWSKLCDVQSCRHQIMAFVTQPGLEETCNLPGTSLVMEDDIILPIHARCVGTGSECNAYLMDMMIGSLSFAASCEHESGVKLTPPKRLPTPYDLAHMRGRGDCKSFRGQAVLVAGNQTCVFPGTNLSVSLFVEPLKLLNDDEHPEVRECDGFTLDQVFGTVDRFVCEEATGFGFNPLLRVPTMYDMEVMCHVTACMSFLNQAYSMVHQDQACWIPGTKLELFSDFIDRHYSFCRMLEDPNPPLNQPSSLQPCDSESLKAVFDTEDATKCEYLLDEVVMKPPIKILQNIESELLCEVKECRQMVNNGLQAMINKPDCLVPNTTQALALRGHFLERAQQYCQYRPEKPKWSCKPALVEQLQRRGNLEPCQRELEAVLKDFRHGNPYEAGWYCPNKFCAALAQDLTEVFLDQDDCALDGVRLTIWRQVLAPCRPITNFIVTMWFEDVRDGMEEDDCADAAAIQTERNWDYGQSANCSLNTTAASICQNTRCLHWAKDVLNINNCERQKMLEIHHKILTAVVPCYYPNDTQRVFLLGSDGQGDTSMTKPDHFPLVNIFSDTETPAPITLRPQDPDPVLLDDAPTSKPLIHPVIPHPVPPITMPGPSGAVIERPAPFNLPSNAPSRPFTLPSPHPDPSNSNERIDSSSSRFSILPSLTLGESPSSSQPPSAALVDWSAHRPNLPSELASALTGGTRGPVGPDGMAPLITTVVAAAIASTSFPASSSNSDTASIATDVLTRALAEALDQPVSIETTREIARLIASTPVGRGSDDTVTSFSTRFASILESHGITTSTTVVHNIAATLSQMLETETQQEQTGQTIEELASLGARASASNSNSTSSPLIQAIAAELQTSSSESPVPISTKLTTPSPTVPVLNAAAKWSFLQGPVGLLGLLLVLIL